MLIYGIHPLLEALDAGKELEKVYIQRGLKNEQLTGLTHKLSGLKIPFQFVPAEKLRRLTSRVHQGVVALAADIHYQSVQDIVPHAFEKGITPLFLLLDRVTDVRNAGAIARTAECCGATGLILPASGSARLGPDAIKASAGALHKIPVCREDNLKETLLFLKQSGLQVFACTEKNGSLLYEADLTVPCVVLLGSEDTGLRPDLLEMADKLIRIPMEGTIGSLNVSVAAGIVLYEVLRQRRR